MNSQPPDSNSTDVAANCQLVANATLPATWQDPVTGKKLYNEAYILGMSLKTGMHEPSTGYRHDYYQPRHQYTAIRVARGVEAYK